MDLRIGHLTFSTPAATPPRASAPTGFGQVELPRTEEAARTTLPATPPPEALSMVDRAAERAGELWREQRELHFQMDEDSGRVIVQVRDLDGRVIRTIPPSEALDVLAGKAL